MPSLSVVTTMYRSREYIGEFVRRARAALEPLGVDFDFVLVDDGSPDDSLAVALELQRAERNVTVVELSRNFGHHKAILAGLREARGELVYLSDCDLEEAPELVADFYRRLAETGSDVVFGVQRTRAGSWGRRTSGALFYKAFNFLADRPIPENILTARLMTRSYVDQLVAYDDREFFLGATFADVGFRQTPLVVEKVHKGTSTYDFGRRVQLMVNAIASSSSKPLVYVFYCGALISFLSFAAILALLFRHFFVEKMLTGWPSLIVSVWFLSGLIILCIGLLGIYLAKVYSETKHHPTVIVRRRYPPR